MRSPAAGFVRSLRSRRPLATRYAYAARGPNTRHAQLALSDSLVGRHGSLDTEPSACRESVRRLFASFFDLPTSSALVVDDKFSGVPIALVPALGADQEQPSSPSPRGLQATPGLGRSLRVLDHRRALADPPSGSLPASFTTALHACVVHVLPAGEALCLPNTACTAIGAPLGSPLPRLVNIELWRPDDACLFLHEGRLAGSSRYCISALYVSDPPTRSLPVRVALANLLHAFLAVFRSY